MTREEYLTNYCANKNCEIANVSECDNCMYEKGRADILNAIKNDLHERLAEEMNSPYQNQSLCQGLYYAIQRCDWFLNDDKEQGQTNINCHN